MSEQKKSKFTDRFIDALPHTDTPTYYWDASLPAFGIRVGKNRKTFTVIRGKSRERLTIGTYPSICEIVTKGDPSNKSSNWLFLIGY